MGNQSDIPQARRYQQNPIICCGCGQQPPKQNLDGASPHVMFDQKLPYGRFSKASAGNEQHINYEDTGSTYYRQKDITIFRRPGNELQGSGLQNAGNYNGEHQTMRDSKDFNALRPLTQQQTQFKKTGFASFKKPSYGAYNANNGYNAFNSYGMHTLKNSNDNFKANLDTKNRKPMPMVDFVGEKDIREEINREKAKNLGPFVGEGKYGGRVEQFDNNKRIIMFLQQNHVQDPKFKFYDTKDNESLLNSSTILIAKKKKGGIGERYMDENTNQNLGVNQNLAKLQQPIELTFLIDSRIILATCLLIVAIIILVLGASIIYTPTNFFICLIIAIILYVLYVLICYIYNDLLDYFYNVRSFDKFEEDYKRLRETNAQLAFEVHWQANKKVIKECYLLSKNNKYTKIQDILNENKQLSINDLKDKQTNCVFIKYKTKTSFFDAESQSNTINYFDDFLQQQKNTVQEISQKKQPTKKISKKPSLEKQSQKEIKNLDTKKKQEIFKKSLKKTQFGYELDKIEGISKKPQQVFNVCYMENEDGGCMITMFVIFTLFGLCLPFLCFFEAYTKRYFLFHFQIQDKSVKQIQNWRRRNEEMINFSFNLKFFNLKLIIKN